MTEVRTYGADDSVRTRVGGGSDRRDGVAERGAALPPTAPTVEVPIYRYLAVLLEHARVIIFGTLLIGAAALSLLVLQPRAYTAQSVFSPERADPSAGRMAGLASQLGLSLGSSGGAESLEFYSALLTSQSLLREAVRTEYEVIQPDGRTVERALLDLYELDAVTPEGRLRQATSELRRNVEVTADTRTGLVTLTTTAPWPSLAEQVNARLLALVNQYNVEQRQSQASAQRRFVEMRLQEAAAELAAAEQEMERFLEQNRRYQESPRLTFQAARLERQVALRQQVYATLAQSYEQSRIDEVRDLPVVTVLDTPENTARLEPRYLVLGSVLGIFVGLVLMCGIVLLRDVITQQRAVRPEEYALFRHAREGALAKFGIGRRRRQ